jgi:hypothetical protein
MRRPTAAEREALVDLRIFTNRADAIPVRHATARDTRTDVGSQDK